MELWAVYSILAALIYAVSNVIDKYIIEKLIKNPILPTIIYGIASMLAAIVVFFLLGKPSLALGNVLWSFSIGIIDIAAAFLYFRAIQLEDVSRIVGLIYIIPLFVAILAAVFLGETFTFIKYFGIVIMVLGAISLTSDNLKFRLKKSTLIVLSCALLWSIDMVIMKSLLNTIDFWTVFSYTRIGMLFAIIPLIWIYHKRILHSIHKEKLGIAANFGNQFFAVVPDILIVTATSLGFVTLVGALVSVQPFFVLAVTVILSMFFPHVIKEDIGKLNLSFKFLGILLLFVGGLFVT